MVLHACDVCRSAIEKHSDNFILSVIIRLDLSASPPSRRAK